LKRKDIEIPAVYLKNPSESSHRNPYFYRSISPPYSKLSDETIQKEIDMELNSMREMIKTFLENPEPHTWEPPTDLAMPSNHEFLSNLRIPCYRNGCPSLLFHELDSPDRRDDNVIKKIFGPGAHKYVY
jgi:hypothetical protein